jgi:hypothetical protein
MTGSDAGGDVDAVADVLQEGLALLCVCGKGGSEGEGKEGRGRRKEKRQWERKEREQGRKGVWEGRGG